VTGEATPERLSIWRRFHVRLSLMYGGLVLAVLASIGGYFYVRGVDGERSALDARLRIAATSLASGIDAATLNGFRRSIDAETPAYRALIARFQAVAAADRDFSSIYIMRPTPGGFEVVADLVVVGDVAAGKPGQPYQPAPHSVIARGLEAPIVEPRPYTDAWGTVVSGYAPIRDAHGRAVAVLGVDVRATRLDDIKRDVAIAVLAALAVAIAVLVLLALIVARSVRAPLARIVEATNAIAAGQLQVRTRLARRDEFGVVGRHFDDMATGLEERDFIKTTFWQYVSPEVVQRMIADRSQAVRGQRRHVAIMFVDIRAFTTLSEGLAPEDVIVVLNDYFDRMTSVLTRHGGRIDKYIGDAIMADWGSLDDRASPEADAVAAARAMIDELEAWNAERKARGVFPLEIGIAIHAGSVVAGSIGSTRKLEFTIIGDAVNVASRLESMCKTHGVRIVVSGEVVEAAQLGDGARWLDKTVLRGRNETTEVYELLPSSATSTTVE
jgi:class 3 adenylate cyclase